MFIYGLELVIVDIITGFLVSFDRPQVNLHFGAG